MNEEYKKVWKEYLTEYLKEKKEDPKVANEKILEKIPIAEIEKFLRKKKLENLKNKEE